VLFRLLIKKRECNITTTRAMIIAMETREDMELRILLDWALEAKI
jgi:hypothetical protein